MAERGLNGNSANRPTNKTRPMEKANTFFCPIEYGPSASEVVGFSASLPCQRPDMDACLDERLFASHPITKVIVSKAQ